ncbi:Rad1/Rec1/Rad17 [Ampelomyces quisqualis]|uniref:Rad1/Rec1/Rad17 n=1 Tax=Ampelomyces quisqualis TaxID=50730 RepID=A0A6A5QFS7_AMPQU|nr:Rad1/Rec1/Rad17 [Ampelomyces quisqualis]
MEEEEPPVLTAVSSSARQLFLLLRCIAVATKAHVTISEEGLKFSVSEGSSMEASTFLNRSLFTTYNFHASTPERNEISDSEDDEPDPAIGPNFQISLPALLETLQIFGLTDPNTAKPPWARDNPYPTSTAFSNNVLGMNNLCRISYHNPGAPLSIILTEASIRTTCDLSTYEPDYAEEIPFDRRNVVLKTIMRGSWLHDALIELSSTSPEKLTMYAKTLRGKPFFAISASGTLGSARVEFNNQPTPSTIRNPAPTNPSFVTANEPPEQQTNLLETFQLSNPTELLRSSYKFTLIQKAARAMSVAKKASIRMDSQGVLSLQFMVEVEAPATDAPSDKLSFVDFVVVPMIDEEGDEEDTGQEAADETLMGIDGESEDGMDD